jgi:hypothetical protein
MLERGGGGYFIFELVEFLESRWQSGADPLPVSLKAFLAFNARLLQFGEFWPLANRIK